VQTRAALGRAGRGAAGLRRIPAELPELGIPRRHGPGPVPARRHRVRGGGVPAARGGPQAVPTAGRRPHLAGPPVGTPGRGGGYGLRLTTAWRRRRRPGGRLGGGRHGGRGGPGTAARRARPDAAGGGGPVSVPTARAGPQAVPTAGRRPHLAGPTVGPTGHGGGYGLRLTTTWRRRRRPGGRLGGGR